MPAIRSPPGFSFFHLQGIGWTQRVATTTALQGGMNQPGLTALSCNVPDGGVHSTGLVGLGAEPTTCGKYPLGNFNMHGTQSHGGFGWKMISL